MGRFLDLLTIGLGYAMAELVLYLILLGLFIVGYGLIMTISSLWSIFRRQR